jgi:PAS domain S-box-containing protein
VRIKVYLTNEPFLMHKIGASKTTKPPGNSKKFLAELTDHNLQLAFDNSFQANIITIVSSGKIIIANRTACKLLGYSMKELLTKRRADIFDINESAFKNMLKQRTSKGHSKCLATAFGKNGKLVAAEITSAVFTGSNGVKKAITTIADMRLSIVRQKEIDTEKDKIVAENIILAKSEQKKIDIQKDKIVAGDIVLAKSKQKKIDTQKDKIVAGNIVLAKSKQKKIDTKKEKIVADNILLAQEKSDARLAENNEWIKYINKASYDVMWDWDVVTGQIYVGESITEMFGYSVKNNLTTFKDFLKSLLSEEKAIVKRKILKALASDKKTWKDTFMFRRSDGSIASTTSRASIMRNEKGKAIRMIGAIKDISRLQELERDLDYQIAKQNEQGDKYLMAAKLSFDVMWDWNLLTNEVFIGEGFEELFGYVVKNNKGNMITDWSNYMHPDDKTTITEKLRDTLLSSAMYWEQAYRVIRADGSVAKVFARARIIRDHEGNAYQMIGALQDLSRQKELEEKLGYEIAANGKLLTEYRDGLNLVFNSSSDVLFDFDMIGNQVLISNAYEKEFGYRLPGNKMPADEWASRIHPDDKENVMRDYTRMLASDEMDWKCSYRFLRADNTVANVISNRIILRDANGKVYRMIGSMQDVSKQTVLEEKLDQEIRSKEKQITEAMEEAKETERSDIGRELHDNVNQLLGVSKLYLDLAKRGGDNSEMYIGRSSQYTISAIEEIRKLTKSLTTEIIKNLGLGEAIINICLETMEVNPVKISHSVEGFREDDVKEKFKMNVFRIVQEQLNNILKHAKAGDVLIDLTRDNEVVRLVISDNGVGFDTRQKQKGIGIVNINKRAASYNGIAEFISKPGEGCLLKVTFPLKDALKN